MINDKLLKILVCPKTQQPLQVAPESLIGKINERIDRREIVDIGENQIDEPIDEGLLRQDGKLLYPVRNGIPILLAEHGILVDG